MQTILVIEDEKELLEGLKVNLSDEGYRVLKATRGDAGAQLAIQERPDLIILDIMLPGINGLEVCRCLRQKGISAPIIMLTAKSTEIDKVLGLEIGADDYLTKPFSVRELIARIHAHLRRQSPRSGQTLGQTPSRCRFGNVEIDFKKYEATKKGRPITLTALEFRLLQFLSQHPGEVVNRDVILDEVWGKDIHVFPRTVDLHIAHLRKKLEDDPARPKHILGLRGVGYKFVG